MEFYHTPISDFLDESKNGSAQYKVLAEGDSWVSHPFATVTNLSTQLASMNNKANFLNYANPGDEALAIFNPKGKRFKKLKEILKTDAWGIDFDLIFISAGGNDIVGPEIIKKGFVKDKRANPNLYGSELISKRYYNKLSRIIYKYKAFIDMKNSDGLNKNTSIVTHTYCYLRPRKVGTEFLNIKFNEGWVKVYLDKLHITDEREQYLVIKGMLDSYAYRLQTLEKECDNFLVIDTRRLLMGGDNMPDLKYWHDEIHPNTRGFIKIAGYINSEIKKKLGSPID